MPLFDPTSASRAVLIEIMNVLGVFRDDLVVVISLPDRDEAVTQAVDAAWEFLYDPRALDLPQDQRACLHAKCIVVDRKVVFVSSANFTEAAQERNIEVGLLVRSLVLADQIVRHFEALRAAGQLKPAL